MVSISACRVVLYVPFDLKCYMWTYLKARNMTMISNLGHAWWSCVHLLLQNTEQLCMSSARIFIIWNQLCVFYRLRWVIDHREQGKAGYCSAYTHIHSLTVFLVSLFPLLLCSISIFAFPLPPISLTNLSFILCTSLFPSLALNSSALHPSHAIFKRQTHLVFLHSLSVLLFRSQGNEEKLSHIFCPPPMLSSCSSTLLLLWQGALFPSEGFLCLFLVISSKHLLYLHPSIQTWTHPSPLLQEKLCFSNSTSKLYLCIEGVTADPCDIINCKSWKIDRRHGSLLFFMSMPFSFSCATFMAFWVTEVIYVDVLCSFITTYENVDVQAQYFLYAKF